MTASDHLAERAREFTAKLKEFPFPEKVTKQVLLGFDGYVDNLYSVVKYRHSETDVELMNSMKVWAERISNASGSSASIERVLKRQTIGGYPCNVGKAIAPLCGRSGNTLLLGAFGIPEHLPIFVEILEKSNNCQLVSMADPGITDAYEFPDGKVMMVNFNKLHAVDWQFIMDSIGRDEIIDYFNQCELYGKGYWAGNPHGNDVYEGMQRDLFPNLNVCTKSKHLLLDLSDLSKKSFPEILELKTLLSKFEEHVKVGLLLNSREMDDVYRSFTGKEIKESQPGKLDDGLSDMIDRLAEIKEACNLSMVAGHCARYSAIVDEKTAEGVINLHYTPDPRFTTSAGDHFTAGTGYGLLVHLPTNLLPLMGSLTASHFVCNGTSPTIQELLEWNIE